MTPDTLWKLFLATGLPEVYNLYYLVKEEDQVTKETA